MMDRALGLFCIRDIFYQICCGDSQIPGQLFESCCCNFLFVNARVLLRPDNFDPPFSYPFFRLTGDNLQGSLFGWCCHTAGECGHSTLRQIVSTWTCCGGRLAPRRANEGYTAEPAACARLVCQAYHSCPGSTICRPLHGLDSLTPDAHRAGPPHP